MITNQNTNNNDDFIISGNWDVFARRLQEKFWQNLEKNVSAQHSNRNESVINSEERNYTHNVEYFINK